MVTMRPVKLHSAGGATVLCHAGKVEEMKAAGWTEKKPAKKPAKQTEEKQ